MVSFDTKEELAEKIDKIDKLVVMIGKLATRVSGTIRQFKPQIHQGRGRGQNKNYNQGNYQSRYRQGNRSNSDDNSQFRQDKSGQRHEQNFRRGNFGEMLETLTDEISSNLSNRDRSRERSFSRNYSNESRNRSTGSGRSRLGSRASTNRDRI